MQSVTPLGPSLIPTTDKGLYPMVVLTALLVSILIIELLHYLIAMVVLILGKINLHTMIIITITVPTIAVPIMETIVMFMEGILITLIII
jgi:hypothetical protein